MKILSANVRYSQAQDGENDWAHRKRACALAIAAQDADIVCFQEMSPEQLRFLAGELPGYAALTTLDVPATGEPVDTIFYRGALFELRSSGAYWLSETPHIPGSRSWQSRCVRLACWAHLAARDGGGELRVLNTHLDHMSQEARVNQARLVNEDAGAYPGDFPQVLTGDMNAEPGNPAIQSFLEAGWADTHRAVHGLLEPGPTFHAFLGQAGPQSPGKIDWIFTRGAIRASSAEIVRDRVDGRLPSDHYFVSAGLEWE